MQIETEGDAVTCCAFSSSGEVMAFGGSGGYVHLWATAAAPRVNMMSQQLEFPPVPTKRAVVYEQDPFALPFPYGTSQVHIYAQSCQRYHILCPHNKIPIICLTNCFRPSSSFRCHAVIASRWCD